MREQSLLELVKNHADTLYLLSECLSMQMKTVFMFLLEKIYILLILYDFIFIMYFAHRQYSFRSDQGPSC